MKKALTLTILLMALACCTEQNPFLKSWDTPYGIPPFDQIKTEDYLPAIKEGIAAYNAAARGLASSARQNSS